MPPFSHLDHGEHGSLFIAGDRVEAEIGVSLDVLSRDPDGPLTLDIGGIPVVERADLTRFRRLLQMRARHRRLFGTELDTVPPFLRRDWRPDDPVRDKIAAELDAALARGPVAPEPITA